jgi:8-oxo-dGTP diphosphatase
VAQIMYSYTLGFIKRNDEILLINREKNPWKGCWNGLGGKLELNELPQASMIREIEEETGIKLSPEQVIDKGYLTWNVFDANGEGLYIFLIEIASTFSFETPLKLREGILDWKKIDWIIDYENYGVADNIPYFLPYVLNEKKNYHYHCTFVGRELKSVTKEEVK